MVLLFNMALKRRVKTLCVVSRYEITCDVTYGRSVYMSDRSHSVGGPNLNANGPTLPVKGSVSEEASFTYIYWYFKVSLKIGPGSVLIDVTRCS